MGIARYGDVSSPGGATFALFDLADCAGVRRQARLHRRGRRHQRRQQVGCELADANPGGAACPTVKPRHSRVPRSPRRTRTRSRTGSASSRIFLTVFSFIAMGVACFVIYNVFSITAAQRQRENALLRAVGAQTRQVTRAMLIESVVVGIIGSLLGIVAGIGVSIALKAFLGALGVDFPSTALQLLPRTIVLTLMVGTLVTVLSAVMPALRTGRVSPLAAMRESAVETVGSSRKRILSGAIVVDRRSSRSRCLTRRC